MAHTTSVGISLGIGVTLGCVNPCWAWNWGWCHPWGWWSSCPPFGSFGYWWGSGAYNTSWFCHPFSFWYWRSYGCWPYGISWWYPGGYSSYYSPPVYYATVINRYYDGGYDAGSAAPVAESYDETAAPSAYEPVGEGVAAGQAPYQETDQQRVARLLEPGPDSLARASGQYLTLGDQAFREQRYADSVHFYSKAVEFAPDEGVLYLVLSDGLFATGDYHYGAYALRKALELDPTLVDEPVDKHAFYADPSEFDRQLAVLETFLADHPTDGDARLLLAANDLFGGRPAATVDLLESEAGAALRDEPAGALILQSARKQQYEPR